MDTASRRERLAQIIENESLKRGHFILASGKESKYYPDCRRTTLHPEGAALVGELILDAAAEEGWAADAIGGPTLGADPMAAAAAIASFHRGQGVRAFIVRKEAKGHGTRQQIEGAPDEGAPVVLVEDVVTSGGSLIKAANVVREAGYRVLGAIVLVDREEGGAAALAEAEIPYRPLFTASELLARG